MKRLLVLWNAVLSDNPLIGIRGLAVLSFLAVTGAFLGGELHHASFADFCGGMALSFSGILVFQVFGLESARTKRDPNESPLTELHLSR